LKGVFLKDGPPANGGKEGGLDWERGLVGKEVGL
jgi:hypothetical protein